eukprot:3663037-Rhodomonas_salina.2
MSGADIGNGATRAGDLYVSDEANDRDRPSSLRARYAMPGTDLGNLLSAYACAMFFPVLAKSIAILAYARAMRCPVPAKGIV